MFKSTFRYAGQQENGTNGLGRKITIKGCTDNVSGYLIDPGLSDGTSAAENTAGNDALKARAEINNSSCYVPQYTPNIPHDLLSSRHIISGATIEISYRKGQFLEKK